MKTRRRKGSDLTSSNGENGAEGGTRLRWVWIWLQFRTHVSCFSNEQIPCFLMNCIFKTWGCGWPSAVAYQVHELGRVSLICWLCGHDHERDCSWQGDSIGCTSSWQVCRKKKKKRMRRLLWCVIHSTYDIEWLRHLSNSTRLVHLIFVHICILLFITMYLWN